MCYGLYMCFRINKKIYFVQWDVIFKKLISVKMNYLFCDTYKTLRNHIWNYSMLQDLLNSFKYYNFFWGQLGASNLQLIKNSFQF